ncbi:MAG: radical SAM protein [Elusimicrobia bacterium]|nr:radical SAM protein [Elusimicrobiota bacterium]
MKGASEKPLRILFIVLPYLVQSKERANNNTRSVLAFPYGVLSIISYLNANAGVRPDIAILDLNLYPPEDRSNIIERQLRTQKPNIAAISMMFDLSYRHLASISKQVKDHDPQTLVLLGGAAATVSWNMIPQEQENVDALCYAEGEYTLRRLVEASDFAETLATDSAWVTRQSLAAHQIPQGRYVDNLNEVINIDYGLLDTKSYSMKEAFSPFSSISRSTEVRQFFLVTSRGCPFKCVFCSEPSFHGKTMRYADVDVLIGHVRHLVKTYGMNVLTIYDDQILLNRPRAKEFFRQLAQFKIRVETPNGLSVAFIDSEMAMLMRQAGLDTVPLAVESGSARMLHDVIHKPLRLDQVKPVVDALHRNDIFVQGYFVVGLPGEREEDRTETVRFIKEVGLDWSGFNLATPLRGSELYRICRERGYIDPNYGIGDLGMHDYVIRVPGIDPAYIKKRRYLMNLEVNFVDNYRMRVRDYRTAVLCFEDVIARYEDHAFAHYYLAKAYESMAGDAECAKMHHRRFIDLVNKDAMWREHAQVFGLPVGEPRIGTPHSN